ncbi:MAG: hypothetical protein ACSHW2_05425 [Parasphingopyxis sp.]
MLLSPLPALAGCSALGFGYGGDHEFIADGGFGAESAVLTLNEVTVTMEKDGNIFTVSSDLGDASGQIRITYNGDGMQVFCPIDYVTRGEREPHRYVVERGECREL